MITAEIVWAFLIGLFIGTIGGFMLLAILSASRDPEDNG